MAGAAPERGRPLALRVRRVIDETADARSFVLDVPEGLADAFRYAPGQYLPVVVPWGGMQLQRCYSLSSAPGLDERPTITVKRVEGGRVSNHLIDHVREGDTLLVHRPAGRFVLQPSRGDRPLLFFAGGSGITPVLSMVKQALAEGGGRVRLLYANRDAGSILFRAELDALAARHQGRFELRHHLDDEAGRPTEDAVRAFLGEPGGADAYLCGPRPFMDLVAGVLRARGVSDERIRVETFVSPTDPDRRAEPAGGGAQGRGSPPSILVTLHKKIHRVPYRAGQTLLAACKEAGVGAPSSCEEGFCGSCMGNLVEGDVDAGNPLALSDADAAGGRVLACQARAASERLLHVDFDAVTFRASAGGLAAPISRPRVALVALLCVAAALLVRWIHHLV